MIKFAVWIRVVAALALLLLLPLTARVRAQAAPPIVVFDHNAVDHGSALGLDVFFLLRDAGGQPLPDAAIESASLRVLDSPVAGPTGAVQVNKAQTPIYIALLLDTSGSMTSRIDAVKATARTAIAAAPPNAQLAVTRFSDGQQIVQGFTNDRGQVQAAIDGISNPQGNTCMYDTVYGALEQLNLAAPGAENLARKAIILFTDGEDLRLPERTPCSTHSLEQVVDQSRRYGIPVNTIGLYADPNDINRAALERLAEETGALSAVGSQGELSGLFQRIFTGLNSQYQATFEVLAKGGENQGILEVKLSGDSRSLFSAPFTFFSPKDYTAPTPAPTLSPPTPEPVLDPLIEYRGITREQGNYVIKIIVSPAEEIGRLLLTVKDKETDIFLADALRIAVEGKSTVTYAVPVANLQPGHEYTVRVEAENLDGELILRQARFDESITSTLAEGAFKYELPTPEPIVAGIQGVTPEWQQATLVVNLDVSQPHSIDKFSGTILDNGGLEVARFGPSVFPTQFDPDAARAVVPLHIPLPAAIRSPTAGTPGTEREYQLVLQLVAKDEDVVDVAAFGFKLTPPAPPSLAEQVWAALEANPLIVGAIFAIILGLVLWLVLGRRRQRPTFRLSRPAEDYTVVGDAGSPAGATNAKLQLSVLRTPSSIDRTDKLIAKFPCKLGRDPDCVIRFTGDRQISRHHAQITARDGDFEIEDLDSGNGTWVDGVKLTPHVASKLRDQQTIELGRQTAIQVRVHYGT